MQNLELILKDLNFKGYSYQEGVVDIKTLEKISMFFDHHKDEFKEARVGTRTKNQRIEKIRGDSTYWLDPLAPDEIFGNVFNFLNTLKESVNSKFYLGLQQYECHLAFYPSGAFYQKHLDCFTNDSSRKLSFVFYLNPDWKDDDGGEIVIYDKKNIILDSFLPKAGSFICFMSDEFPHEVKSSNRERRSLTGWMHNKIIY